MEGDHPVCDKNSRKNEKVVKQVSLNKCQIIYMSKSNKKRDKIETTNYSSETRFLLKKNLLSVTEYWMPLDPKNYSKWLR